ncbi:MAG TPA: Imm50 family immunity protein [Pyrinomonadaceae bacterium]|nr:Imm50 family immunity protein [Pyrinomonadaceae bacterium]
MSSAAGITNVEALTDIFGRFPSFHDAEIHSLRLERGGDGGPSLEAKIHVFEMTAETDESGRYVLKNHTLVTFRFTDVVMVEVNGFNGQNVLALLDIVEVEPGENEGCRFEVRMPSVYGCEAHFGCREVMVVDAVPYERVA